MKFLKTLFILFSLVFFIYLSLPNFGFPNPPPGSLQSGEPADTETPLRRAYFTDFTRSEVLSWYKNQMQRSSLFGLPLPTYLLNYPPEDAQTIIRDQTRSTFLEEIVHPMRESVYVNGFEPTSPKDAVVINGINFRQKIIVKIVPSSVWVRLSFFAGIIILTILLFNSWKSTLKELFRGKLKIW